MHHAIIANNQLNHEQLQAITHRGSDVVVTAGAGTGKTRALVGRYLSLLAEGLSPRQIVAITFTHKAADEVRNRVRASIARYIQANPGAEAAHWRAVSEALDAARIGTIHSLCAEIIRAHPAETATDPRFSVLEEADGALLKADAVDAAVAWAAAEKHNSLFTLFGERRLRAILGSLLNDRLDARLAFEKVARGGLLVWQERLQERQQRHLQDALCDGAFRQACALLQSVRPIDDGDLIANQWALAVVALHEFERASEWETRRATLRRLDQINLTGGRQSAWPGGKEQVSDVKDALRALRKWWRALAPVCNLELNASDEAFAAALPSLHQAFLRAEAAYDHQLGRRRALDFDDLEENALALLRENEDVRRRWQDDVEAILVDEYQDTNGRQRDLINLINGQRSRLFVVGDAKQSIYRFRGAQVAVFREERARIEAHGRALELAETYRAHAGLVAVLNTLLAPVLGEAHALQHPWQEPFASLHAARGEAAEHIAAPYLEIQLTAGSKSAGALDQAARLLAQRMLELTSASERAVPFSDFAVLCRASTSFAAYEDAFDAARIPYITVAGRGFFDRPEIRDLLNALQAMTDPLDDLALVGFLRSPVVGFSDSDLLSLVDFHRASDAANLWTTILTRSEALANENLKWAAALLSAHNRKIGRLSIGEVLKSFLDQTDYRAALRLAGHGRALRNVDKLLEIANKSAFVSTADFLEYVAQLRTGLSREGEARSLAEDAVQIMTVHQAKGLEFPIVILGDISYEPRGPFDILLDSDLGLIAKVESEKDRSPAAFELAKIYEGLQQDAESARLLYVAATRAREKLIVNGVASVNQAGRLSTQRGWLKLLEHALQLPAAEVQMNSSGAQRHEVPLDLPFPAACWLYEPNYNPPLSLPKVRIAAARAAHTALSTALLSGVGASDPLLPEEDARTIWRVLPAEGNADIPAHLIGDLVHQAIDVWHFPNGVHDPSYAKVIVAKARQFGIVDERRLRFAAERTMTLLLRFKEHWLYEKITRAEKCLREVPFTMTASGASMNGSASDIISGRIDLLYLDHDGWHIVDFKSDPLHDRGMLDYRIRQLYAPQLTQYQNAVQRIVDLRPTCAICLLDYQGQVLVVDPHTWRG